MVKSALFTLSEVAVRDRDAAWNIRTAAIAADHACYRYTATLGAKNKKRDEKGLDSKVVLSRVGADGRPLHALTPDDRQRMTDYFNRYKAHQPGAFAEVYGWGTADDGREYVRVTHAFFLKCRGGGSEPCRVSP